MSDDDITMEDLEEEICSGCNQDLSGCDCTDESIEDTVDFHDLDEETEQELREKY